MKQFTALVFIFIIAVFLNSCGNDSTGSGGLGPGGGGSGSISFTMSGQGDPNNYTFAFKPSVDTKISNVIATLAAQGFADTLTNNNPNYVYSKDTTYALANYIGVQSQQAWTFKFSGTINSNNQAYTVTSNFTVP